MKTYQNIEELPFTLSVEELAAFLGISRVGACWMLARTFELSRNLSAIPTLVSCCGNMLTFWRRARNKPQIA